jgi:hypothetical protein
MKGKKCFRHRHLINWSQQGPKGMKMGKNTEFAWMSTREICDHLSISSRTLERYRKRRQEATLSLSLIARIWADPTGI